MFVEEKRLGEQQVDTRSDLERFIAWAKTQDPKSTYEYTDPFNCLIARWDGSEGRQAARFSMEITALFDGRGDQIVQYGGAALGQRTVGGALAIALKLQGEK